MGEKEEVTEIIFNLAEEVAREVSRNLMEQERKARLNRLIDEYVDKVDSEDLQLVVETQYKLRYGNDNRN